MGTRCHAPGRLLAIMGLALSCSSGSTGQAPPANVPEAGSDTASDVNTGTDVNTETDANVETVGTIEAGPAGGPVAMQGVYNARHTGGLITSDGRRVRDNVLIRAGHLGDLDATGCGQFAALSIQSVVDLRDAADASATPDADCVTSSSRYYLADLPKILPPSGDSYLQTLTATEPKLAAIYGHIAVDGGLPAVIHCVIGRDRASLITALVLLSIGVPQDQVLSDFVNNQEAQVEEAWLAAALDRVTQQGGIETYLRGHGVTDAQIAKLKELALVQP